MSSLVGEKTEITRKVMLRTETTTINDDNRPTMTTLELFYQCCTLQICQRYSHVIYGGVVRSTYVIDADDMFLEIKILNKVNRSLTRLPCINLSAPVDTFKMGHLLTKPLWTLFLLHPPCL
jgi:hypothetical protein